MPWGIAGRFDRLARLLMLSFLVFRGAIIVGVVGRLLALFVADG